MIVRLLRRYNRAVTLVSIAAVGAYFLLPNPDIARGVLIGGLLPVFYLGIMREHLGMAAESDVARVRGRMFLMFLVRFGLLAAGLGFAFWLSTEAFLSAVVALAVVYFALLFSMSRELCRHKVREAKMDFRPAGDRGSDQKLNGDDGAGQ